MAYVTDITLTDDDVLSWSFTQELADTVEPYELQGVTAGTSGNSAVYARSPGSSPGSGSEYVIKSRVSPDDQTQCNLWCGLRYAMQENIFFDSDGVKYRGGELTLKCPGQYNVLDFDAYYVKFNYQGKRVDFDAFLFYLKSFAYEIDADTLTATTVFKWQVATYAAPGDTYTPPEEPTE